MNKKIKVIIIAGPTGVGKTNFSLELAKKYNGEIISSDSMQIYKKMDIGTAKIKFDEMQDIPHHLIDIIEPEDLFSVSDFQKIALEKIQDIHHRGKTPIIVGGTGLYIDSIVFNMDFNKTIGNPKRREELESILNIKGKDYIVNMLKNLDPLAENRVDLNNMRRVIRAIEIIETTGNQKNYKTDMVKRDNLNCKMFILIKDRELLYESINTRVNTMISDGLVNEVIYLKARGLTTKHQSMKAIGYRQIFNFLNKELTFEESVELIKRDSRRYAKRQLTWFKKYRDAITIDIQNKKNEEILKLMHESIEKTC